MGYKYRPARFGLDIDISSNLRDLIFVLRLRQECSTYSDYATACNQVYQCCHRLSHECSSHLHFFFDVFHFTQLKFQDTVLVGLLVTNQVECIWNDRQTRIIFPVHAFPTGIEPYRPPQSIKDSCISKIVCCDETFAALSSNGEVFTFSSPNTTPDGTGDGKGFKPQRVWALRKKFSAVKVC